MLQVRSENQALLLFHYIPNKTLAIVGLIIFGLFATYLTARVYLLKRARFFYILHLIVLMEFTGYLIRSMCSDFIDHGRYVGSTLFLLLSPDALALVDYKAVGEIIRLSNVQTKLFCICIKFVTWFFFSSNAFSLFLQGASGGLRSSSDVSKSNCIAITLVGLSLQLFLFANIALITSYTNGGSEYNYRIEDQKKVKRNRMICVYITLVLQYIRYL